VIFLRDNQSCRPGQKRKINVGGSGRKNQRPEIMDHAWDISKKI
jgi:hypothetical protein